jgi:hypothetical protein
VRGHRLVVAAAAAFAASVPISQAPAAKPGPVAVQAKTCSAGFTHAVINGSQKCLRRGEFCAHRADRQYRRYGFRCVRRDARGNYHLT